MSDELGDALRKAYEKHEEAADVTTEDTSGDEASLEEATPAPDEVAAAPGDTAPESETPEEQSPEPEEDLPVAAEAKDEPQAEDKETESPVDASDLAPQAWRGAAKQHWSELPDDVKQEVMRREQETNRVLNDSAEARQFTDRFMEMASPYASIFQSENVDPLTAAHSLFQTAAELRAGTAEQKAGIIHELMVRHGIDESLLDKMLVGELQNPIGQPTGPAGGSAGPNIQQMIRQEMAPFREMFSSMAEGQQRQTQAEMAQRDAEIDKFAADPANLFFADVMPVMAELFEAADRSGRSLTLEQAYKTAVSMDPQLAELQSKRDAALKANSAGSASARRERAASVLKPTQAQDSTPPNPTDREDQLRAAWDAHARR